MKISLKKLIDKAFEVGILIKSLFGIFEVLAGIVFAVSGKLIVNNLIVAFAETTIPCFTKKSNLLAMSSLSSVCTNLFNYL